MSDYKELRISVRADGSKFQNDMKSVFTGAEKILNKPITADNMLKGLNSLPSTINNMLNGTNTIPFFTNFNNNFKKMFGDFRNEFQNIMGGMVNNPGVKGGIIALAGFLTITLSGAIQNAITAGFSKAANISKNLFSGFKNTNFFKKGLGSSPYFDRNIYFNKDRGDEEFLKNSWLQKLKNRFIEPIWNPSRWEKSMKARMEWRGAPPGDVTEQIEESKKEMGLFDDKGIARDPRSFDPREELNKPSMLEGWWRKRRLAREFQGPPTPREISSPVFNGIFKTLEALLIKLPTLPFSMIGKMGGQLLGDIPVIGKIIGPLASFSPALTGLITALGTAAFTIQKFNSELNSATKSAKSLSTSTSLYMGSKVTAGYMDLDESKFFQAFSRMGMSFADPRLSKFYEKIGLSQGALGESDSMVSLTKLYETMRSMSKGDALFTSRKIFGHSRAIGMEMVRASEYIDEFIAGLNIQSSKLNKLSEYSAQSESLNDTITTITNGIMLSFKSGVVPLIEYLDYIYKTYASFFFNFTPVETKDIRTLSAEGKTADLKSQYKMKNMVSDWEPFQASNAFEYFYQYQKTIDDYGVIFDILNETDGKLAKQKSSKLTGEYLNSFYDQLSILPNIITRIGLPNELSKKLYDEVNDLKKNLYRSLAVQNLPDLDLNENLFNYLFEEIMGNMPNSEDFIKNSEWSKKLKEPVFNTFVDEYNYFFRRLGEDFEYGLVTKEMFDEKSKELVQKFGNQEIKDLRKSIITPFEQIDELFTDLNYFLNIGFEIDPKKMEEIKSGKIKELYGKTFEELSSLSGNNLSSFNSELTELTDKLADVSKLSAKYPEYVKDMNLNFEKMRENMLYSSFQFLKPQSYDRMNDLNSLNSLKDSKYISDKEYETGRENLLNDVLFGKFQKTALENNFNQLDTFKRGGYISDEEYWNERNKQSNEIIGGIIGREVYTKASEIKGNLRDLSTIFNGEKNIPENLKNQVMYGDIYKSGNDSMKQIGQNYKDLMSEGYSDGAGFTDMGQVGTSMSRYGAKMDIELKNLAEQQLDVLRGIYQQLAERNYNMRLA